ncbi:hypothetical protein VHA_002149 [Grimontia hollisae CIP 101886]|uniref:Uncharacterized protein n=1 Tax=Grimontia hollisae CIP 101886 TaxID=675812 RepID=D0I9L2_GRIHO|nr:hypothetical protein VHA_002149 [Grimontia hollisae CIP 101886]
MKSIYRISHAHLNAFPYIKSEKFLQVVFIFSDWKIRFI